MAAFQQEILFAMGASIIDDPLKLRKNFFVKAIFYWLMSMLSFAMILAKIESFAEVPLKAPLVDVLILGGAFVFSVEGMCVLAASFFEREVNFIRATTMYPMPAFILSGYTFPTESMGAGMQPAAKFFPLSYMANNLREIFLTGAAPNLFHDVLILILIDAISFALATKKPPEISKRLKIFSNH